MGMSPGTKLGPYEIVGPLGAGGMGEVYRARDTRLGRDVALKVLPASFTADAGAKARFEREAKTISGLNHPHICVLYDVGTQDGFEYLVMECVEGETLAKRLEKGPLPLEQVVKYGAQIAEALDRAHRSGIVHRDLKPGNVMLTSTGAKLLDFGLAKETGLATMATITGTSPAASPVTQQGTIVGTFQYMSPEQIEGRELDGRSDIFSLGAVLYEMVTGKRAFEGKTQLSVASAIIEREPEPIRNVKSVTPPALERAIQRCLMKDPDERWQAAKDLALELSWIGKSGSQAEAPAVSLMTKKRVTAGWWLLWSLLGALAVGVLAGAIFWRNSGKTANRMMVFSAPLPFAARDMAVAPNGHTVAIVGYEDSLRKTMIWLYEAGGEDARVLKGTEGGNFPFWAPDGKALGFFAEGKLKRIQIPDGPIQILCDAPSGRGGSWSPDGTIIFTPVGRLTSEIDRVSASGGTPTKLEVKGGGNSQRWPVFLPDGKHYLFLSAQVSKWGKEDGLYAASLDSTEAHLVVKTEANGVYAAPGYLLYLRDRAVMAQPFDLKKLELTGEPVAVATDPQFLPRILKTAISATDTGMLLVQKGGNVSLSKLRWFDRGGKELDAVGEAGVYANPEISVSGKTLAVDQTDVASDNTDVWTYDLPEGGAKRLTFDPAMDANPVWKADASAVVFTSTRGTAFDLYLKEANGAREETLLCQSGIDKYPQSWSHDGKTLLYLEGTELKYLTMPEAKSSPFLKTGGTIKNAQFSPDGKWVAYASNESGKWEVYVTSFPEARGKWQVSSGGGEQPRWRGDGKELFYLSPEAKIMAVPVKGAREFDAGVPVALFQSSPKELLATSEQYVYDVDPNGQKILVNTQEKNVYARPMTVVLHWGANGSSE